MTDKEPQDGNSSESKPLGLTRPGRLELRKTVESGQVRQSFSHGRTKTVQVEKKKKRTFKRTHAGKMAEVSDLKADVITAPKEEPVETDAVAAVPARQLTEKERAVRARAVEGALKAESEARVEENAAESATVEIDEGILGGIATDAQPGEIAPVVAESETADSKDKEGVGDVAGLVPSGPVTLDDRADQVSPSSTEVKSSGRKREEELQAQEEERSGKAKRKSDGRRLSIGRRGTQQRRRSRKMTVVQALNEEERQRSLASVRRARAREKREAQDEVSPLEARRIVREVVIPEVITVQELANRMAVRGGDVVKTLVKMGVMATINEIIESDTAELVVNEFGHNAKRVSESDVEIGLKGEEDLSESLVTRPPVVTVMGHVDHGKTSLLDALRDANVAGAEAGGITQHIGAYQVEPKEGAKITFIDTPGHEAFTQMRARGANATDIVVLVVAADDGVMPQTVEAIQHAKAAEVPIIVAINKIDLPNSNSDRVKNDLLQHNVILEHVGGDVLSVEVSAKEHVNLDKLVETINLQAELLELKANPDRPGEGLVVESRLERGKGVVATVLVQRGTIHSGDIVVAGGAWGRVRSLLNDKGAQVGQAGPSEPVEVLGLNETPNAGDEVVVVDSESRAREVTEYRDKVARDQSAVSARRGTVEQMFTQIAEGEVDEVALVIKADVHGSLEAILANLAGLGTEEVQARVLLSGVGGINESDISLAAASGALAVGFNVRADAPARTLARRDGVDIRYYSVIYELLEDIGGLMSGLLAPTVVENTIGYVRVKEVFSISKIGKIAGCEVTEGLVRTGAKVRLLRDNVVVHEGQMSTLKRHKDDVREVKEGLECGIGIERYQDIKEGDVLELFEAKEVARSIADG